MDENSTYKLQDSGPGLVRIVAQPVAPLAVEELHYRRLCRHVGDINAGLLKIRALVILLCLYQDLISEVISGLERRGHGK